MYDVVLQTLRDTGGSTVILSGERSEGQLLPKVYAEQFTPGRGRFVRRGERPRLVQIANFEPEPVLPGAPVVPVPVPAAIVPAVGSAAQTREELHAP